MSPALTWGSTWTTLPHKGASSPHVRVRIPFQGQHSSLHPLLGPPQGPLTRKRSPCRHCDVTTSYSEDGSHKAEGVMGESRRGR